MSDQDNLTISVQIGSRNTMNSGTPKVGPWTYHHVLPVRLYYMIAWTILRVCIHRDVWKSTAAVGRDALIRMCNNGPNQHAVRVFIEQQFKRTPTPEALNNVARRCASPPAGGFGGPNPALRVNDPHEQPERFPPLSAPQVWFNSLRALDEILRENFQMRQLPEPNSVVSSTKKVARWCRLVETMATYIKVVDMSGTPRFEPTDWLTKDDHTWTLLPGSTLASNPNQEMKLRQQGQGVAFRQHDEVNLPISVRRLQRSGDYLKVPPPPPPSG